MPRGGPQGDRSLSRKKSANERTMNTMRNSSKRPPVCSLCMLTGHKAGVKCGVVHQFSAVFIPSKEAGGFAANLGNSAVYLVEKPDSSVKPMLKDWLSEDVSIPSATKHIVVKRCFYSAATESYQNNVIECSLLEVGGRPLEGHNPCYFPAYKVSTWITKNACVKKRKKHVLSILAPPRAAISQSLYDYSP